MVAKYDGTCKSPTCVFGGKIHIGQEIVWNRTVKGQVYHAECSPGYKISVPNTPAGQAPALASVSTPINDASQGTVHQNGDQLANVIAQAVAGLIKLPEPTKQDLDESRVIELVKEHSSPVKVTRVEFQPSPDAEVKDLGIQHETFPLLLKMCGVRLGQKQTRTNIMLVGPAGSGKSHAAEQIAKALGLEYSYDGAISNEYALLGYKDASGTYQRTLFRERYENGGLHCLEEVDGYSPSAAIALNNGLANGHMAFPDKMVQRHPDFLCIAGANTWGLGATNDYVGRNKLDAAFLSRFSRLNWDYDNALEILISGNEAWAKRVQAVRKAVREKGIKIVITPRASERGAAYLAAGIPQSTVEDIELRAGMSDDQWNMVKGVR